MRIPFLSLLLATCTFAGCGSGAGLPGQPQAGINPAVSVAIQMGADSLFTTLGARLASLGYRVDLADPHSRRFVVRPPDDETRVEIRIVAREGTSELYAIPSGGSGEIARMAAVLELMHDVTLPPARDEESADAASGELPDSRWITEFFLSPTGRLWSARTGLFTADSLFGRWARSFGGPGGPVDPDKLRVGTELGFVTDDVMVLGVGGESWKNTPLLYRSTDGGASWASVPAGTFEDVRAIAAVGPSVWVFATELEKGNRQAVFLRSTDGGETWERMPLPEGIRSVTQLHRVSVDTAYLAIAGFDPGPVFWHTTDGGAHWTAVPTPHDQRLHRVPENGVHIEEIATVGDKLVVREYGRVFYSRSDTIRWNALKGVRNVAPDLKREQLFVLTEQLEPAMLDQDFNFLWRGDRSIPRREASEVTAIAAHDGVGYVVMQRGALYEARDGIVRIRQPR